MFATDDADLYARQLDYFGIELGMLRNDNKIIYAYHLSKPKPDTRVLDDRARNENRYYLTWHNADSQKADGELLARAGIDAGDHLVLKFLSQPLEMQLLALERSYREANPKEIARTRFGVRGRKRVLLLCIGANT